MMSFSKYIFCTILFTLFLGIGMLDAQERVVNEDGDVIILMPNGKWKFEDKKKENQRTDKNAPLPKNLVPASPKKPSKKEKGTAKGTKKKKNPPKEKGAKKKKTPKKPKAAKKVTKKTPKSSPRKDTLPKDKKPKTVTTITKPSKQRKKKATVYPVPKRERKIKSPVIEEQLCEYSMKEKDEFTNKLKVATKPQPFFTYTQEDLKKFMRENDYLTCTGNLSRVIGMTIFNAKFEVESTMAKQEYGEIQQGTQMLVKLLNGKTVTLTCQEGDEGTIDEINGKTVYRTYFSIDKNEEKELRKSEVIKVRMLWSTGYEDYEINELDFFINQLNCLDQIKE